jgi:hypothetical protein
MEAQEAPSQAQENPQPQTEQALGYLSLAPANYEWEEDVAFAD